MHDIKYCVAVEIALSGLIVVRSASDTTLESLYTSACFAVAYILVVSKYLPVDVTDIVGLLLCAVLSCIPAPGVVVQIWSIVVVFILRVLDKKISVIPIIEDDPVVIQEPEKKTVSLFECF